MYLHTHCEINLLTYKTVSSGTDRAFKDSFDDATEAILVRRRIDVAGVSTDRVGPPAGKIVNHPGFQTAGEDY